MILDITGFEEELQTSHMQAGPIVPQKRCSEMYLVQHMIRLVEVGIPGADPACPRCIVGTKRMRWMDLSSAPRGSYGNCM